MPDILDESDEGSMSEGTAVAKSAGLVAAVARGQQDAAAVFTDEDRQIGEMISAIASAVKLAPLKGRSPCGRQPHDLNDILW
jgi:hypothetical protein